NSVPPTSGPHASWTLPEWGVYNAFIPPEVQVHHLAHGEVIVHYRPDAADPADVERLRRIVREIGRGVLMHPNPEIDHPIVLTAWGRILRLEALEEPLVRRFIDQYRTLLPQH